MSFFLSNTAKTNIRQNKTKKEINEKNNPSYPRLQVPPKTTDIYQSTALLKEEPISLEKTPEPEYR